MKPDSSQRFANSLVAIAAVSLVCATAACTKAEHKGAPADILTAGQKLYSQFDEELIIRHFFDDRRDGFYVDVGCYHWEQGSTTAYLEKHLGWKGFAFDALPTLAESWKQHRPGATFFNYIVTDHSGTEESFYVAGQLSSVEKDHIKKFKGGQEAKLKEIKVPTITLNEVLDREGIKKVDFLSMDIEAGEPPALRGFDIDRFKPELVCVEAAPQIRDALMEYFTAHDYERIEEYRKHDTVNWYFKPAD